MVIHPVGDRETYLITNVYGPQRSDDKLKLLDFLVELRDRHARVPWIMGGDFNMIKSLSKKKKKGNKNFKQRFYNISNFHR